MLEVYREVAEDVLAVPVLQGRKTPSERFAGAVDTFTIEGLMRDRKALQCGTSHFLGQNFSKAYDVTFLNRDGEREYAWGTSWGFSARMVGGTIMAHGDDRGLKLPPAVAPVQVVVVPIYRTDDERSSVLAVAAKVRDALAGSNVRVRVDDRDQHRPGYKFSEWELKGVPLRIEIGPKDVAADQVVCVDRIRSEKRTLSVADAIGSAREMLDRYQSELFEDARRWLDANTHDADDYGELRSGIEEQGGFWRGGWCGDEACEAKVKAETSATIRTLPVEQRDPGVPCTVCGRPAVEEAIWARAY